MLSGKKSMRWADFDRICRALSLDMATVVAMGEARAHKEATEAQSKS